MSTHGVTLTRPMTWESLIDGYQADNPDYFIADVGARLARDLGVGRWEIRYRGGRLTFAHDLDYARHLSDHHATVMADADR